MMTDKQAKDIRMHIAKDNSGYFPTIELYFRIG